MHNFTYIMQHLVEWSTKGYVTALGFLFWPLFFTAIIGYVYIKQQSLVVLVAAILIIFAAFFTTFISAQSPWMVFLYVGVSLIVAGLVLFLFKKWRGS